MTIEKKYQVFVSSTKTDLLEERQQVQQALLESDCIPIGMEFFPPSDETAWEYIRKVIKQCDYYLLIIAGRYGSINPASGISFTEQEYNYALKNKVPVITFFHRDPSRLSQDRVESNPDLRKKLEDFRASALTKLARPYSDPHELYGCVMHGISHLKRIRPDGGWIPARYLPADDMRKEFDLLHTENTSLRAQLEEARTGMGSVHAIDVKPNHIAARESMKSYITEALRISDTVSIRVLAVSLYFSWDFLHNEIPYILSDMPDHKKIILELAMVEPKHLEMYGIKDWKEKGEHIQDRIKSFIQNDSTGAKLFETGRLELFLWQYRNIPHWHGILINNNYLFLGRTRPIVQADKHLCKMAVGEEVYRLFSVNDQFGGADRITLFNCWFDFYKYAGVSMLSEFPKE